MLCILLYVAVDEGSDINEELDSDQTKIMETRGNAHTKILSVLPKNFSYWSVSILYFRRLDAQQITI